MTREEAQIIIGNIPIYGDDCYTIPEYQEAKAKAIEALEAQRWMPVSKKLPEKEGRYWVWAEKSFTPDHADEPNRYQGSTEAAFFGGRWYGSNVEEVIAWMPLPEPY